MMLQETRQTQELAKGNLPRMGVMRKVFRNTLTAIQATSVTQRLGLSRKESGYSFRTCAFRLPLFLRTSGVYKVRSERACLGSNLHVKV